MPGSQRRKNRVFATLGAIILISLYLSDFRVQYSEPNIAYFPSINKTQTTWIHQSWMEYPYPLSFPSAPSLLNKANTKPLNILLVNYHRGVENEIHAVLKAVLAPFHQTVHFTHTRGIGDLTDFAVTEAASKEWYPLHEDHCNSSIYDLIIVGDVVTYSRPYLQSLCKTNIILYITNRFDFGIWGDPEWAPVVESASRWPNVRVIVNNYDEYRYSLLYRNIDIHIYAYAPSTGLISDTAERLLATSQVDWSRVDENELLILDRAGQRRLLDLLREKNIPVPFLISNYGGPLDLVGRIMLHIPYQVNTMALFENLNAGVLYVLPSKRLYLRWLKEGTFIMKNGEQDKDRGRREWTEKELTTYADWYRTDLSFLFFYFDELEDLAPGSAFRRMVEKNAKAKREIVKKYMTYHVGRTIEAWRQAVGSFPRLSEANPVMRKGSVRELPLVAKLGPPTPD